MKFSKEQKEDLARFLDTIAASAFVGAVVGSTGHSPLSRMEIGTLFAVCPITIIMSFFLRK